MTVSRFKEGSTYRKLQRALYSLYWLHRLSPCVVGDGFRHRGNRSSKGFARRKGTVRFKSYRYRGKRSRKDDLSPCSAEL